MANHNPFLVVDLGDFNVISEYWYKYDKTSYKRAKTNALMTQFGLQQIIKETTPFLVESYFYVYFYVFFILIWREIALYTNTIQLMPNKRVQNVIINK